MLWLRKSKKGFTLIELMVVVAIIGVLVLLGLRAYSSQKQRAMNSIAKANASTIQTMLVGYMGDHTILLSSGQGVDITKALGPAAAPLESMVNPYSDALDVYRISVQGTSAFDAGLTPATDYNGMVDVVLWTDNVLLVNARGAKAELIMDYSLPANKY